MDESVKGIDDFIEHVATRDEMHRIIDGIGEKDHAMLIVFRDETGDMDWKTINLYRWSCIGMLETVRDEMRVIRKSREVDNLP